MTSLFVRALKGEPTERHPVWMMRQAGRYLPGYRAIRAKTPFLTLCSTPELAAEVTMEPIERFDMDAAIVFADILLTADAMGIPVTFPHGGPRLETPIKTAADVDLIHDPDPAWMTQVSETVRILRNELPDSKALIGFSAAPWTLCAYMIEGGTSRDFWKTRAFAHANPVAFRTLLTKVADALVPYLQAQIDAGADVIQLFDTWAGMADAQLYEDAVLPAIRRVLAGLQADIPVILFAGIGCGHRLELAAGTGVAGVSLDWATNLADAYARVDGRVRLQGNLDPTVLLSSPEKIQAEMQAMLAQVPAGHAHLVNLGHGVLKETPPDHVAVFAEAARSFRPAGTAPTA